MLDTDGSQQADQVMHIQGSGNDRLLRREFTVPATATAAVSRGTPPKQLSSQLCVTGRATLSHNTGDKLLDRLAQNRFCGGTHILRQLINKLLELLHEMRRKVIVVIAAPLKDIRRSLLHSRFDVAIQPE